MAGTMETPLINSVDPKSKREAPAILSIPIMATHKPITPPIHPFNGMSVVTIDPQINTPNSANIKYSGLLNIKATLVIGGAIMESARIPMNVPRMEAALVILMAVSAFPCFASGFPSNAVAAAEAVPGMFKRMADILPP